MTVVAMSHGELSRYDTLLRVERRELRVADAAVLLGLTRRQISRLRIRLLADGADGLVSRKRGSPSNRRFSDEFRERVLALVREHYCDFSPTLAAEYLVERHGVRISHETLRKLMISAGLWKDRDARRPRPYQPRYRRDCRGELVQVDGSKHWWSEDRGPQCTLLVYIDDATSELMHFEMVESESTFSYMRATQAYIERHNKHLDAALIMARAFQELAPHHRSRNNNEPSRPSGSRSIFAEGQSEGAGKIDGLRIGRPKLKMLPQRLSAAELKARGTAQFVTR